MNCANQTGKTHIHSSSVYNTEERHNNNSNPQQLFRKKLRGAEKLSKQLYIKHRQDETHVHGTKTSRGSLIVRVLVVWPTVGTSPLQDSQVAIPGRICARPLVPWATVGSSPL